MNSSHRPKFMIQGEASLIQCLHSSQFQAPNQIGPIEKPCLLWHNRAQFRVSVRLLPIMWDKHLADRSAGWQPAPPGTLPQARNWDGYAGQDRTNRIIASVRLCQDFLWSCEQFRPRACSMLSPGVSATVRGLCGTFRPVRGPIKGHAILGCGLNRPLGRRSTGIAAQYQPNQLAARPHRADFKRPDRCSDYQVSA